MGVEATEVNVPCDAMFPLDAVVVALPFTLKRPVMRCAPVVVALALKRESPVTVSVPAVAMLPFEPVVVA